MEKRIEDWKDLRFGMFIHWGLYAIPERGEWAMYLDPIDKDEYRQLMHSFRAENFDARKWAAAAKSAGMKYMVLTTRHHDGFSLWDSKASHGQFTAMHAAAKRDFVRDYVSACREAGLKVGFYYSPMDWRFPGFFFPKMYAKSAQEMRTQCHEQLRELLTDYGKIDILWFDGGENYWLCHGRNLHEWESKGDFRENPQCPGLWGADELYAMIRELQPDIVINNRFGNREYGDFLTPEREIGEFNTDEAWESCMTINDSWGYVPNPPCSLRHCIQMLVRCATGDGNLLLNVGPKADGSIAQDQLERLSEIGEWLDKYGESIYNTRGGFLRNDSDGGMTWRDNVLYIHVLDWKSNIITTPEIKAEILSVTSLTAEKLEFSVSNGRLSFSVSPQDRCAADTIIKVELDRHVSENISDKIWRDSTVTPDFGKALIVEKM